MPPFVSYIFTAFFVILIIIIILNMSNLSKMKRQSNTPIKTFSIDGKKYALYSKQAYTRYYNNQVVYELKDSNNTLIGTFNTLNDVLVFLAIDKFPSEDMFG